MPDPIPVSLEQALSMVNAWPAYPWGFQLHQIARALRRGLADLQADAGNDAGLIIALKTAMREVYEATGVARDYLPWGEWITKLRAEIAALRALEPRLGTLRRENDELRRAYDDGERRYAGLAERLAETYEEGVDRIAALEDERDKLQTDYGRLAYRAAQSGVALIDGPDQYGALPEHYTLQRTLDLMEVWRPGVERWGLHQMCRVLRDELTRAVLSHREIEERLWSERDKATRALAAIPCARAQDNCPCPDYRYAPCCNLRVAMWAGEPFETDHLAESGEVHLFEPAAPEYPGAPRQSAGCVKLVEPDEEEYVLAYVDHVMMEDAR